MAKLILREACFKGIENAIATEFKSTPEHKAYVKQANEQIEKNRLKYATAYNEASSYFNI